jgi:hypothetical protein
VNAGASAAAQARLVGRGRLWQRALRAVGVTTPGMAQAQRRAGNWSAGAEGERRTAQLTNPLDDMGWFAFHDRAIPGMGRANLDHLWISPCARAFGGDSKWWTPRPDRGGGEVRMVGGRLMHGSRDVNGQVDKARKVTERVAGLLGVPVTSLMAVHGAPVRGGGFEVRGVYVVPAGRLLELLRHNARGGPKPGRAWELARLAEDRLPRYVQ